MQVAEDLQPDGADGVLADAGEDGVAQFGEDQRQHPRPAVGQDQAQRHGDRAGRALAQRVDRVLVQHRHVDGRGLGREQTEQGDDHARLQAGASGRP